MSDGRDQRREERHPLLLRVDHPEGSGAEGVTENLSAGGLFIRTDRAMELGERTPLLVGFPGLLEPIEIQVEVVWFRPEGGEGPAGVAVRIPADRPEDRARIARIATAAAAAPEPAVFGARQFRILVAEDNALVETMYDHALKLLPGGDARLGIAVEFARDGLEALARLERKPRVDLLIADLYMPVMDGFQLVKRMRALPDLQAVPVVAISGGGAEARARALEAGVDIYLKKPVKVAEVLGTVRTLLRIR